MATLSVNAVEEVEEVKGYRIVSQEFLNEMIATKKFLTNCNGEIHKYSSPHNTFMKSNAHKCFWFFTELVDALYAYHELYNASSIGIAEFSIPKKFVHETAVGVYYDKWALWDTERKELVNHPDARKEFTTVKLHPSWLHKVYHIIDVDSEYHGYEVFGVLNNGMVGIIEDDNRAIEWHKLPSPLGENK